MILKTKQKKNKILWGEDGISSGPFFKVLKRKTHRLGFVIEMTGKRLPYA